MTYFFQVLLALYGVCLSFFLSVFIDLWCDFCPAVLTSSFKALMSCNPCMKRAIQIQLLLLLLYFLTVCSSSSTSHGENHRCPVNSGLSVYCSWPEAASPPFLGNWPRSSCRRRETHDRYEEEMLVNSVYHVFDLDFIWIYSVCLFFFM